jgi:hypothetical protein
MGTFSHITKAKEYMLKNIRHHTDYQTLEVNADTLAEDCANYMDWASEFTIPEWIEELAEEIAGDEEDKLQAAYELSERHDIRIG